MARQESIILLRGPVGNLSFYKMNGEYFARKKSGVSGERIKSEPAYARTRENIAEFGQASTSSKLLRRAFRELVRTMADSRVTGRLTAAMLRVVKSDEVNLPGQRRVSDGKTALLKGFEFNKHCKLHERFRGPFSTSMDCATGAMSIEIPAFTPTTMILAPPGATHFRLVARGAAIAFDGENYSVATSESSEIPINQTPQQPLKLSLSVSVSRHPMFLVLGMEFLQSIKNGTYSSLGKNTNAMAIVDADDNSLFGPLILSREKNLRIRQKTLAPTSILSSRGRTPTKRNRQLLLRQHVYNSAPKFSSPLRKRDPSLSHMPAPVLRPPAQDKPPEKDGAPTSLASIAPVL